MKNKGAFVVRRCGRWVAAALVVLACTACSGRGDGSSNEEKSAQALSGALAEARTAGVDQTQIDALSGKSVTFEQYKGSVDRALDCMRTAGLQIVSNEIARYNGQDVVSYTVASGSVADDQAQTVNGDCYKKFAQYVDQFWQTSTVQELDYDARRTTALREPLAACLDKYGVDVVDHPSFHDLVVAASQHVQSKQDEDCLNDVGYSTWEG